MMKTKMKRVASLTVGIVALAILVSLALILSFQLLTERASTTTAPRQTTTIWQGATSELSLADAVAKVEPEMRQRAADATLFRAEGAWRPGEGWREIEMPPLAWTLYYYSPSESNLHAVTVSDAQNFWAPPTDLPLAPRLVTSLPPPHGIDVAWLSFRAAEGDAFLRTHTNPLVAFQLQPAESSLHWTVSAIAGSEQLRVVIDAQTGAVLSATN
jgi:hypothetical protein